MVDKDIKTAAITVVHMFKNQEEILNLVVEIWEIKKNQMEYKIKSAISEMKNILDELRADLTLQKKNQWTCRHNNVTPKIKNGERRLGKTHTTTTVSCETTSSTLRWGGIKKYVTT